MHKINLSLAIAFGCSGFAVLCGLQSTTQAQSANSPTANSPAYRVVVNSNQDTIQADDQLTLREAIALTNGSLKLEQLSATERSQVTPATGASQIEFNLTQGPIQLTRELPPLLAPGLVLNGGISGDLEQPLGDRAAIPTPTVELTAAPSAKLGRGLTIAADGVTVRGLSIHGFASNNTATESTPPADIFISDRAIAENAQTQVSRNAATVYQTEAAPKNVVIEHNWLGLRPDGSVPDQRSAFGVSVFNARSAQIKHNRIAHHDGSAIITGALAEDMQVEDNQILSNGLAGMPDAIRLEGQIDRTTIQSNLICANDGSGVFLFKSEGAIAIQNNQIKFNGRRFRRAAVYLMGSHHRVLENQILGQPGSGVVVTAFGNSQGNLIQNNRFNQLEGLSIDLVTARQPFVQDFQMGDGVNPPRNSHNRRPETGNGAVNAPEFFSREFFRLDNGVTLEGKADPGNQVTLYRTTAQANGYGPLTEPLTTVQADVQGRFTAQFDQLQPGDQISAIATDEHYGTSEPALATRIRELKGENVSAPVPIPAPVECLRASVPVTQTPPEAEPMPLRIPRNVHFALDQDHLSPASQTVLDQIAQTLRDHPSILVELHGHTDPRASNSYNQDLAARRARNARNYLVKIGIAPERLTLRSWGETQRHSAGNSKLDYARDRRVELVFKDNQGFEIITQEIDLQLE